MSSRGAGVHHEFVQDYANSDGLDFDSGEIGTLANRPKLTVTYTPPGGATPTPTPTPTPTGPATATPTPSPSPLPRRLRFPAPA